MSSGGVDSRRRRLTRRGIIPYDLRLVTPSRENRKKQTKAETALWAILREKKLKGYKFTRQKPIDRFILDFYCSKLLLGIEVDGSSHDKKREYDEQRTQILNYYDIKILRILNDQIINDLSAVSGKVLEEIKIREEEIGSKEKE
jgi:very-short-patch-repair endonuclease